MYKHTRRWGVNLCIVEAIVTWINHLADLTLEIEILINLWAEAIYFAVHKEMETKLYGGVFKAVISLENKQIRRYSGLRKKKGYRTILIFT